MCLRSATVLTTPRNIAICPISAPWSDIVRAPRGERSGKCNVSGTDRCYGVGDEEMAPSSLHVTDGVSRCPDEPPWRQGMEYDAGLFFVCYQRDPGLASSRFSTNWRSSTAQPARNFLAATRLTPIPIPLP